MTLPDGSRVDFARYLEEVKARLEKNRDEAQHHVDLGDVAVGRLDWERAARLYELALEEWPDSSLVYVKLTRVKRLAIRDRDQAEREQIRVLQKGLRVRPRDPLLTIHMADVLVRGGKFATAAGYVEDALKGSGHPPRTAATLHRTLGDIYVNMSGRDIRYMDLALKEYGFVLQIAPNDAKTIDKVRSIRSTLEMRRGELGERKH